jgi:uncharacterized MAPEG superfamily protein
MPFYFWSIFIAGLLPYVATMIAKSKKGFDNAHPRDWLAKQEGFRARAHAAQLNSFEALPFYAAAVIVAHLRSAPPDTMNTLAIIFIVARVAYLATYVGNIPVLRSLAWFVGIGSVGTLFFIG